MLRVLLICGIYLILAGCANQIPPSGGLEDKIPPVVVETEPANGTLNFQNGSVVLKFSKYMNKNNVLENIFVSPTVKTEFDWSGKELEIEFAESLNSNTTYAITLGTEYSDLKGNKPTEAFTLIFSTGNKIDSGAFRGTLYGGNPVGVFIFAFSLNDINADTLDPGQTEPHYKIQVGANGKFEFNALKDGNYRFFAIRDEFKDNIYDEGTDAFGASLGDVHITKEIIPEAILKIGPSIDKSGPLLFDVVPISSNRIIANFSEAIDTFSISKMSFILTDSLQTTEAEIASAYISANSANGVEIITKVKLDTLLLWRLQCKPDSDFIVKDSTGNPVQDTSDIAYFYSYPDEDTFKPELIALPFRDSVDNVELDAKFTYVFNTGFDSSGIADRLSIIRLEDSLAIDFNILMPAENHLTIMPLKNIESTKWYCLSIDLSGLEFYNGEKYVDTTISLRFQVKDIRNYGGASGIVKGLETDGNNLFLIMKKKDSKLFYKSKLSSDGKWEFAKLPPAIYTFELFKDKNGNEVYDYGSPFPFRFAEPFYILEKEIEIKPRWKFDDIILEFSN